MDEEEIKCRIRHMRYHTKPKIQLCPTCGRMRCNHPGARLYECPVPKEVIAELKHWKRTHDHKWKAALVHAWEKWFDSLSDGLQRAKELIGPERLYKIKV